MSNSRDIVASITRDVEVARRELGQNDDRLATLESQHTETVAAGQRLEWQLGFLENIQKRIGDNGNGNGNVKTHRKVKRSPRGLTQSVIIDVLRTSPSQTLSLPEIVRRVRDDGQIKPARIVQGAVRNAVRKLAADEASDIRRVGRGQYALK